MLTFGNICGRIGKRGDFVKIFDDEIININRIVTVVKYETQNEMQGKKVINYNPMLSTYELIFFFSGDGYTYYDGVKIRDCKDSIRYLPKGVDGSEYRVDRTEFGECIDIYFDTDDELPKNAIGLLDMMELRNKFEKIYNLWSSKKTGYYAKCMSVLYDIISAIQKQGSNYLPSGQVSKLDAAHEYLIANFKNKDFDYTELCAVTGMSYSYFKELFITKYGMPPVKYLTHLRLEYAKDLLVTGRYTVSEIAEQCGFENVYYFSSVFKKNIGVSPKKYKI